MLQSLRLGFATNSSSAHSVILHSDPCYAAMIQADTIQSVIANMECYYSLTDTVSKLVYLLWLHKQCDKLVPSGHQALALRAQIQAMGQDYQALMAMVEEFEPDEYDHALLCPDGIDLALWFQFVLDAPITIHAYSDSYDPPYAHAQDPKLQDMDNLTFHQDGQAIIGFDRANGFKFRWAKAPYTKSRIPELVDMKITDFCAWGCKFCYQGSTTKGAHAPWPVLQKAVKAMAEAGVFEIAVGGGEPVTHPQFPALITLAQQAKITLNFTTYGIGWSEPGNPIINAMADSRWKGGIGVSVNSVQDVQKAITLRANLRTSRITQAQVMAQTVVGATTMQATQNIVEACIAADIPVLLLGYKTTGRGGSFKQRHVDTATLRAILERAQQAAQSNGFSLSVDTAFIDTHAALLDALHVPNVLRTSPEGKFSMYVDAVENTAAPSSYCGPQSRVAWNPDDIATIFARF